MEEKGMSREEILKLLKDARKKDLRYLDGKILNSMCTPPLPFSKEVWGSFMETNLGDAGLFPGTKELESEVIKILGGLLKKRAAKGFVVSGGTEANIMALWVARNMRKKKKPEVIVPETAHFSFDKASNLLNLRLIKAGTLGDHTVDLGDVERHINENTVAIVGIAGSTEYGTIDDIEELANLATKYGVYLHVDAAFGGLVVPLLKDLGYPIKRFDFSLEGVSSITIDPHKMGMAPMPSGCILFRDENILKYIETSSPYLTEKRQFTIIGTRPGASAASTYAVLRSMGREGYRRAVGGCMELTMRLHTNLRNLGFESIKPTMNIVVFGHERQDAIAEKLSEKGWLISRTKNGEIRLVIMPHVTENSIGEFIEDLREILGDLDHRSREAK